MQKQPSLRFIPWRIRFQLGYDMVLKYIMLYEEKCENFGIVEELSRNYPRLRDSASHTSIALILGTILSLFYFGFAEDGFKWGVYTFILSFLGYVGITIRIHQERISDFEKRSESRFLSSTRATLIIHFNAIISAGACESMEDLRRTIGEAMRRSEVEKQQNPYGWSALPQVQYILQET